MRTSFLQSLKQYSSECSQVNKIEVGKSFFQTMICKIIYIDMIGIMIKDDVSIIKVKLL